MRKIIWQVVINDGDKIVTMENAIGFPTEKLESHLTIIGILENLKQKHLDKMKTLFEKTVKSGEREDLDL